jgi:hypothetical protein|tara:strand:- start:266 stop:595 length:330 start_codon:yes stop_codon:yes gene_type:complete
MAYYGQNACGAWVNFNGSGTVAIRDDYNVSSITDSGTGAYKVNMTNAMSNSNYAVTANNSHNSGVYLAFPALRDRDQVTRSTTQFHIDCLNNGGAFTDGQELHVAVFAV